MSPFSKLTSFITFLILFSGCSSDDDQPENLLPATYLLEAPTYFGAPIEHSENKLTPKGIELGRKLFYDPILSKNNDISCASCHQQHNAFADQQSPSTGDSKVGLERNSPTLFNLAWKTNFFWDGGAFNLESQILGPLTHADEMAANLNDIIEKLGHHDTYPSLFQAAFQDTIKTKYILYALAQFQKTLISKNTSYDLFFEKKYTYTHEELIGKTLFEKNCTSCHSYPHFSDFSYHNNGLDSIFNFTDPEDVNWGRYRITYLNQDKGKYHTPSLRNIAVSAPYMHDGRFKTLSEVINHYSEGIKNSHYTATQLPVNGFQFSLDEKLALEAFLRSLTDEIFLSDSSFSNSHN